MVYLTERERIDILIMVGYGDRRRTQQEVCTLFNNLYPNRAPITQSCVSKLIRKYANTGSVRDTPKTGRPQTASGGDAALNILLAVHERPRESCTDLQRDYNISERSVRRVLKREKFHPYKVQLVQELVADDFDRRLQFCEIMRNAFGQNPDFVNNILFSDEATFMLNGYVNRHNCRYWAQKNPNWLIEAHTQRPQKLNVWAGIINDNIIGPFFVNGTLTMERYLNLLSQNVVPTLQAIYPNNNNLWFQHDGAPAHFGVVVRNYLNNVFPNRWIGRRGTIEWPARSPDLNPCDFFLWGYIKDKVYRERPNNLEDLRIRIIREMGAIENNVFGNVRRSFRERLEMCIQRNGRHIEH